MVFVCKRAPKIVVHVHFSGCPCEYVEKGRGVEGYVDSARRPPSRLVDALAVLREYELAICVDLHP